MSNSNFNHLQKEGLEEIKEEEVPPKVETSSINTFKTANSKQDPSNTPTPEESGTSSPSKPSNSSSSSEDSEDESDSESSPVNKEGAQSSQSESKASKEALV